jgi:hypothetical protein
MPMIPLSGLVSVSIDPASRHQPALFSWNDLRISTQAWEEIWGSNVVWPHGRGVCQQVIDYWKSHDPIIENDSQNRININPALPSWIDQETDELYDISRLVPHELRETFLGRTNLALSWRFPTLEPALKDFLGFPITPHTKAHILAVWRAVEMRAKAEGNPEFWQLGAVALGLDPNPVKRGMRSCR